MKRFLTFPLLLALLLSALIFTGCERKDTPTDTTDDAEMTEEVSTDTQSSNDTFMQTAGPNAGDMVAIITTNHGVMKAVLFETHTPETVKNFSELAKAGNYDGTIFHRVIKDFMIQGGDFENGNGTGGHSYKGPGTMFGDEFHDDLLHIRGALSMANRGPATNGSQFFIVHTEATPGLNGKHSVFGQVFEGLEVLDAIATTDTLPNDKPVEDVVLQTVEIIEF